MVSYRSVWWTLHRPERGVFKWAWYRAKSFVPGSGSAAGCSRYIVALIISRVPLPPHPTSTQNLIATVLAIVGAIVLTGVGSYVCALMAAPFQQRNVLRTKESESAATIAALRATPVTKAHEPAVLVRLGVLTDALAAADNVVEGDVDQALVQVDVTDLQAA